MTLQDHPEARELLGHPQVVPGRNREASEQKCAKAAEYTQVHEAPVFHIHDNILECLWPQVPHFAIN